MMRDAAPDPQFEHARMPIVAELVKNLREQRFHFGANVMLFGVQHIMAQTLGLTSALRSLGIAPENIALCGKPYSTHGGTVEALRRDGVMTVTARRYRCDRLQSDQQIEDLNALSEAFLQRRQLVGDSIVLVLDDGGHALTRFNQLTTSPYRIAGVEQTASGFWQPGFREVPFPVVDVGASACKRLLEPDLIVDAAMARALNAIEGRTKGLRLGIIGLGYLGTALASRLEAEGAELSVFDRRPSPMKRFKRHAAESIHSVFDRSDVIFGCAGLDVTAGLFDECNLRGLTTRQRTLISLSSGDDEFFSLKSALLSNGNYASGTYEVDDIPDICGDLWGSSFRILRNGFPVNFDNSAESVPLEHIQGTVAALVIAICQTYKYAMTIGDRPNIGRVMLDVRAQRWLFKRWRWVVPHGEGGPPSTPDVTSIVRYSSLRTRPKSRNYSDHFARWTSEKPHFEHGRK
ncbi:NAD(P)-dependent oxidoreductase [Vitreimonas sp.]|uniref:NAD(P)-dependent oxidoreductase n=1 Tax=Vitreimonas sp. TaxID=3069702 RepID=UPI002ED7A6E8